VFVERRRGFRESVTAHEEVVAMYEPHHTSHESGGHTFLSGLLFGAAVGAAVGLLLAPRSGAEVRGQVVKSASNLRKRIGNSYGSASSKVADAVERGREGWKQGLETFKQKREEFNTELGQDVSRL
jgi:gas vesicle protein